MIGRIVLCLLVAAMVNSVMSPFALGGTKEELMRLQSDVLAMQSQMREFEKTYNEKIDGLKSLVVQLNDQVANSNVILDRMAKTLENQSAGARSSEEALIQEFRKVSGRIDDLSTRVSAMAQQMSELKVQAKAIEPTEARGGLTPDSLFYQANGDLLQENFDLAIQGFTSYLEKHPGEAKAADAQYGLGEAYYRTNRLPEAMAAFTRVITDYPSSEKVPTALYRRGKVELALQERDNAIADFRDIITRFPSSPEASLAQRELKDLGASPAKPAPKRKSR